MKVIDAVWFLSFTISPSDSPTIGIVLCKPDYGTPKAYIGTGGGRDESYDAEHIANFGAKYPSYAANALFNRTDIGD